MLFGDWGTSRLYVLGLAFFFSGYSSLWYMLAMSALLVAVGWAYDVICQHFPDGGGVYSAARQRSKILSLVGALLLCADYVVTAALSALDAFHYLHLPHAEWWAAGGIALVGVINYFGPSKAGVVAMWVALCTVLLTGVIAISAIPYLGNIHVEPLKGTPIHWWSQFTLIILAISGVEAVANMTGIMVKPVAATARKAIWPVLAEIVIFNLLLTLAMHALPPSLLGVGNPEQAEVARNTMLNILAEHYVGPTFAWASKFVFAALLLSAVNTAVTDLVSVQFMLSRDNELPGAFGGLNRWGMPLLPLVVGTLMPLLTVLIYPEVDQLAELYAIGVVGAIAINVGSCATNRKLGLKHYETAGFVLLGLFLLGIWLTIAYEKPRALAFAGGIVALGLIGSTVSKHNKSWNRWVISGDPAKALPAIPEMSPVLTGNNGSVGPRKRIFVATRGNPKLLTFAFDYAKSQNAEVWVAFIRHIAVNVGPADDRDAAGDMEAQMVNRMTASIAEHYDVPWRFIYATATNIPESLLEIAATHAVDTLVLGATRRGSLWRVMKGDVIGEVAELLPEGIQLLIHA